MQGYGEGRGQSKSEALGRTVLLVSVREERGGRGCRGRHRRRVGGTRSDPVSCD